VEKPAAPSFPAGSDDPAPALKGDREMLFPLDGAITARRTPVFDGERMLAGNVVVGPAVIEEETTSILVEPGWRARLNEEGTFVLNQID
jgi:N-methylhydantoinase A